uniref:Uncharacterized protein n=1 Tax=Timema poppense TaxID=170557 RepID=A0A7R9CNX3_TIMPO|nr:unnamed protein product [Timema poppensis]
MESRFGKTTLSTPDRCSNLDRPIIGSLVYCDSSALNHATTKAVHHSSDGSNQLIDNCALHSTSDVVFDCYPHIGKGWGKKAGLPGRESTVALAVPALDCWWKFFFTPHGTLTVSRTLGDTQRLTHLRLSQTKGETSEFKRLRKLLDLYLLGESARKSTGGLLRLCCEEPLLDVCMDKEDLCRFCGAGSWLGDDMFRRITPSSVSLFIVHYSPSSGDCVRIFAVVDDWVHYCVGWGWREVEGEAPSEVAAWHSTAVGAVTPSHHWLGGASHVLPADFLPYLAGLGSDLAGIMGQVYQWCGLPFCSIGDSSRYLPCEVGMSSCAPCIPWTSCPEARMSCGMAAGCGAATYIKQLSCMPGLTGGTCAQVKRGVDELSAKPRYPLQSCSQRGHLGQALQSGQVLQVLEGHHACHCNTQV